MAAGVQVTRQTPGWPTPTFGVAPFGGPISNPTFTNSNFNAVDPTSRQRYTPYGPSALPLRPAAGTSNGMPPLPSYDVKDSTTSNLPPHNEVEMTREMLTTVLDYFSQLLPHYFDWNVVQTIAASASSSKPAPMSFPSSVPVTKAPITGMRLVVHGGACMLLHSGLHAISKQQQTASPSLPARTKTRDVDIIHRGFVAEYSSRIPDAAERLKECIRATAKRFNLGADWMNSDADVALPMAQNPADGRPYDPIYTASVNPQNIALHTIYQSQNGLLTLISVTPFWAVALKLVRYTKWDANDICLLLRNGTLLSHTQWTPETLEGWLHAECWAMGYVNWDANKKAEMRMRIDHAIETLAQWTHYVSSGSTPPGQGATIGELTDGRRQNVGNRDRVRDRDDTRERDRASEPLSAHDVMGGSIGGQFAANQRASWGYGLGASPQVKGPQGLVTSKEKSRSNTSLHAPIAQNSRNSGSEGQGLHVSMWALGSQEQPKPRSTDSRSKSRGRKASRPPSRNNVPEEEEEIFIPPLDEDEDEVDRYAHAFYDRGRAPMYRRSTSNSNEYSAQQSTWGSKPSHTVRDPVAQGGSIRSILTNRGTSMGGSTAPGQWDSRPPVIPPANTRNAPDGYSDPYSMQVLDEAIGGMHYGSESVFNNPTGNYAGVGAGYPPVIPAVNTPDVLQHQRKKKDKQRKVEHQRARGAKLWHQSSDTESESDLDSDDEDDKENRMQDRRQRRGKDDPFGKPAQGGPWHQLYAPSPIGRSTSGQQGQQDSMFSQDPTQGYLSSNQYAPYSQMSEPSNRNGRNQSKVRPASGPASRNPSPDNKRRPAPLHLTPPPVIPALPPQGGPVQTPVFSDPSLLAQWQFEQQQKSYEREREEQQQLAAKEMEFYQRRHLGQGQSGPPEDMNHHQQQQYRQHPQQHMQMQMQMQQQQQQQYLPQWLSIPQQQQMYRYQQQVQMQHGIYR